jgi:hypothetical protein
VKQQHRPHASKPRRTISVRVEQDDIADAKRIVATTGLFTNISHFYELAIRNMVDRYRLAPVKSEDSNHDAA